MHEKLMETEVLVIGAGLTGAGIARDLTLRGVPCLIVEKDDVNAGASGRNHGLLHSGARYVANDPATARECRDESQLLKQLAPESIEDTGGLYVACAGDDENYIADFTHFCRHAGIRVKEIDRHQVRDMEPELADDVIAAYEVDDACVDPFKLCFDNLEDAKRRGATLLTHTHVTALKRDGDRIREVRLFHRPKNEEIVVRPQEVINATGAWASEIAQLAGLDIALAWSKGAILVAQERLSERVINRLRFPTDGDILVPGGTVSLVGTTSIRTDNIDDVTATFTEVDFLVEEVSRMLPRLADVRYIRAFAGVRPLFRQESTGNDRSLSRSYVVIDHQQDGIVNMVSIVGGKLTTYRLMAEKTVDLVMEHLGRSVPCSTGNLALPANGLTDWILPGKPPQLWHADKIRETLLCECEMVPRNAIRSIIDELEADRHPIDLLSISRRSRLGKGSCQGAFCSFRTTALLYDLGKETGDTGLQHLIEFLEKRWRGIRPILWGPQMVQEQLQEALHCGFLCLEQSDRHWVGKFFGNNDPR